jgi:hypothetical protein
MRAGFNRVWKLSVKAVLLKERAPKTDEKPGREGKSFAD